MRKPLNGVLLFALISLLFLAVACDQNPEAEKPNGNGTIPSPSNQDAIDITDGAVTDLTKINAGEELLVSLENGKDSTLLLEGATIDSLYVIEKQNGSEPRSLSRDLKGQISQHWSTQDLFVILPQEDGKVSFSGADIGIDDDGEFKIKRLGNIAELKTNGNGDNFFQYKINNTPFNYREEGYPEFLWPTYLNYYVINLNDQKWEKYKDQKVVVYQAIESYALSGGSETSDSFGVVDIGRIMYGGDIRIRGLYDMNGKDHLYLYSCLRNPFCDHEDLRFETYVLLPKYLEKNQEFEIGALPLALVFDVDSTEKKSYVISLRDVPESGLRDELVYTIKSGDKIDIGAHNGENIDSSGFILDLKTHDGKYDADILVSGIDADFLMKLSYSRYYSLEEFGKISFRDADESDMAKYNDSLIDLQEEAASGEHVVNITNDTFWTNRWELPEDDTNTYLMTVDAENSICFSDRWGEGGGNGGHGGNTIRSRFLISNDVDWEIGRYPNGVQSIYPCGESTTITWKVEIVDPVN